MGGSKSGCSEHLSTPGMCSWSSEGVDVIIWGYDGVVFVHRGSMLRAQAETRMAGVPLSPQAMLQRQGTEMPGLQAMISTRGTLTRQLRMGAAHMLPRGLQGLLRAMIPLAMTPWAEALRYGHSFRTFCLSPFIQWILPSMAKIQQLCWCLATIWPPLR